MGLSASQARLLSITQRINNNELQSEIIANNKIMLSEANVAARDKYIGALDSKAFDYVSYNDTGIQETVAFTFNALNQYTPLKNQYSLYNTEGQLLVSAKDAENFQKSDSLFKFLNEYGLFDRSGKEFEEIMKQYDKDIADYNEQKAKYDQQLEEFNRNLASYQEKLDDYNKKLKDHLAKVEAYNKAMEEYLRLSSLPKLYSNFLTAATTGSEAYHYSQAKRGDSGCLLHVLNNLLKDSSGTAYPPYTTSAGSQITGLWEDSSYHIPALYSVGENMKTHQDAYVCDGIDVGTDGTQNLYEKARRNGEPITDLIKLASDFIEIDKGGGNYSYEKKSLYQKTIDMYYLILNSKEMRSGAGSLNLWSLSDVGASVETVVENYVEGDMKGLDPKEPDPVPPLEDFTEEMPKFEGSLGPEPKMPKPQVKIYDKPLAQWYINLWYAMDGQEKPDKISTVDDEQANFDYYIVDDKLRVSSFNAKGEQTNKYYQVIDTNLANDTSWLQFALTNGIVTMKQAALQTNGDILWTGIEYSSTSDIRERDDNSRIAKAEAEYKKSLYQIQAEDKEYDMALKKLDTEHSALLQEVESLKNVMSKNTERSFTSFS